MSFPANLAHPIYQKLDELYQELEQELQPYLPLCQRSSRCCHFKDFEHRLYSTSLEVHYLFLKSPSIKKNLPPLTCSYLQENGACGNREGRPLGCRIFFCDPTYQKEISHKIYEKYQQKIEQLLQQFEVNYFYGEMTAQLNQEIHNS